MAAFPPEEFVTLLKIIPSYLYKEYDDDEDLRAFVRSYNEMAQQYMDWFVAIGLPVYTGPMIVDELLDWVAEGLYGISRPTLPSGNTQNLGPYNTFFFNQLPFNQLRIIGPQDYYSTNDDVFKRVITWHFFKGDGKVFNIRWLKRRIMRFLNGVNGTNYNIDSTYQVSVSFGLGNQVNITILSGIRTVTGGAVYNRFAFNVTPFNQVTSTFENFSHIELAPILKEAIDAGALELPFQFTYVVNVT